MQSIQNFIAVVYSPGGAILSVNSVILNPKQPDIRLLMYFYFIAYRILVVKTVFQKFRLYVVVIVEVLLPY